MARLQFQAQETNILLAAILAVAAPCVAQEVDRSAGQGARSVVRSRPEESARVVVPSDAALLELDLQADAAVSLDGRNQPRPWRFSFQLLTPGKRYPHEVSVRFADNSVWKRRVLIRGGQVLRLAPKPLTPNTLQLVPQIGHRANVMRLAVSPDGKWLLSGAFDGTAILWDIATGRQLRVFGQDRALTGADFTADSKRVMTSSYDGKAILWDCVTGKKLREFSSESIFDAVLSPDGEKLLTACLGDERAILWDLSTGERLRTFAGQKHDTNSVAFAPDGRRVALGCGSWTGTGEIAVRDAQTGAVVWRADLKKNVARVVFSPDGSTLVTLGGQAATEPGDGEAILWDAATGKRLHHLPILVTTFCAQFSADSRTLLTPAPIWKDGATLWDVATGAPLKQFISKEPSRQAVQAVRLSRDGRRLFTGHAFGAVSEWDLATGKEIRPLAGETAALRAVAFSDDGRRFLSAGRRPTVWDLFEGKPVCSFGGVIHEGPPNAAVFGPDSDIVLSANGTVGLPPQLLYWDTKRPESPRQLTGPINGPLGLAFRPGEPEFVVVGGWSVVTPKEGRNPSEILAWRNVDDPNPLRLKGHQDAVYCAAFSPNGKQLITGGFEGDILLWDVNNWTVRETLRHPNGAGIVSAAYSPDGARFATGSGVGGVAVWNARDNKLERTLARPQESWTRGLAFSRDSRLLARGASDGVVVWNVETGEQLWRFSQSLESPCVAFGPGDELLAAASLDGVARLWDLATGDEVARLIPLAEGTQWMVVTPSGLFDGSAQARQAVAVRVGEGLNVVPIDRFFTDCYHPGLLTELALGKRPVAPPIQSAGAPPQLQIIRPIAAESTTADSKLTVEVAIADRGRGLKGPWIFINGARVETRSIVRMGASEQRVAWDVELGPGRNVIEVKAASADGAWESEPARMVVHYETSLARPSLHVLAVGIDQYKMPDLRLNQAAGDARAVAALFQSHGAKLYGQVDVTERIDAAATRANIVASIKEIAGRAKPEDVLLVYFAGHGVTIGQRYYFVPHETVLKSSSLDDDIRRDGLPMDEIGDALAAVPALKRLMIFDTCQSGAAATAAFVSRNPFAFRGAIERLSRAEGVFVLAASSPTGDAAEVAQLGHGALTYALLAGLGAVDAGPLHGQPIRPADPEGVVNVLDWFGYATSQTASLTRQFTGREQQVHMSAQGEGFPLLPVIAPVP